MAGIEVKNIPVADMQQAYEIIKRDFGSDAVLISSRKVRQKGLLGLLKKPTLEVSVAYEPDKTPAALRKMRPSGAAATQAAAVYAKQIEALKAGAEQPVQQPAATTVATSGAATGANVGVTESRLDELERNINSLDKKIGDFLDKFALIKREVTYDYSEGVSEMLARMLGNQVREELAHSVAKEAEGILKKEPEADAYEVVKHLVRECLGIPESISHKRFTRKTVLFMGPTGVGKTTSIAKLAADFTFERQKKVGIINTDTYRIGAQEQLQKYADILDIPSYMVYNEEELTDALTAMEDRDIIFIDTAGKKPGDEQHRKELEDIIRIAKPEDIILCISAATSFAAVKEIIDSYGFTETYKLLITKLDETQSRGMILNICWYSKRALTYVTVGQTVPDDIAQADTNEITDWILNE